MAASTLIAKKKPHVLSFSSNSKLSLFSLSQFRHARSLFGFVQYCVKKNHQKSKILENPQNGRRTPIFPSFLNSVW